MAYRAATALWLMLGVVGCFAGSRFEWRTVDQKASVTFTATAGTTLPADSLLYMVYEFTNLREYTRNVAQIKLIESWPDSHRISFDIKYLFYEATSLCIRRRYADQRLISIDTYEYHQNTAWLPTMLKGTSKYIFDVNADSTFVTYTQSTEFDREFGWLYKKVIELHCNRFVRDFEHFLSTQSARP